MKTAIMRLPYKLKKRKCWVGSYGGHFSVVVVFNKKPVKGEPGAWNEGEYDTLTNEKIIAGVFGCESFNDWFGTEITPDNINIVSVEEYEITAMWNDYGQIMGLDTNVD